jgi:hypothetical protein
MTAVRMGAGLRPTDWHHVVKLVHQAVEDGVGFRDLLCEYSREPLAGRDIAGLGELLEGCEYAGKCCRAEQLSAGTHVARVPGEHHEFVIPGRVVNLGSVVVECVDEQPDDLKQRDGVAAKLHLQPAKCLPVQVLSVHGPVLATDLGHARSGMSA